MSSAEEIQVFMVQEIKRASLGTSTMIFESRDDAIDYLNSLVTERCTKYGYTDSSDVNHGLYLKIKKALEAGLTVSALTIFNSDEFTDLNGTNYYNKSKINFYSFRVVRPSHSPSCDSVPSVRPEQKKEISCSVCKRMNDEGVSVCWNCGNHP